MKFEVLIYLFIKSLYKKAILAIKRSFCEKQMERAMKASLEEKKKSDSYERLILEQYRIYQEIKRNRKFSHRTPQKKSQDFLNVIVHPKGVNQFQQKDGRSACLMFVVEFLKKNSSLSSKMIEDILKCNRYKEMGGRQGLFLDTDRGLKDLSKYRRKVKSPWFPKFLEGVDGMHDNLMDISYRNEKFSFDRALDVIPKSAKRFLIIGGGICIGMRKNTVNSGFWEFFDSHGDRTIVKNNGGAYVVRCTKRQAVNYMEKKISKEFFPGFQMYIFK